MIDAHDLAHIPQEVYQKGRALASETQRLLNGYIAYLKRQKPGEHEPGHDINMDSLPESDQQSVLSSWLHRRKMTQD